MDAFDPKMKLMLKQNKAFNFFILLFAFLCGNLFILTYSHLNWGLLLIFSVIFFLEVLSQVLYSKFFRDPKKQQKQLLESPLRSSRSSFEDLTLPKMKVVPVPGPLPQNSVLGKEERGTVTRWPASCFGTKEPNSLFIFINTLKRGFLLGFFLEAFKVGS